MKKKRPKFWTTEDFPQLPAADGLPALVNKFGPELRDFFKVDICDDDQKYEKFERGELVFMDAYGSDPARQRRLGVEMN